MQKLKSYANTGAVLIGSRHHLTKFYTGIDGMQSIYVLNENEAIPRGFLAIGVICGKNNIYANDNCEKLPKVVAKMRGKFIVYVNKKEKDGQILFKKVD